MTSSSGQQVATVQWHTWSDKIDLVFTSQARQITYKDNLELPSGSLGRLFWSLTQGNAKQADIKCADRTGATIVTVVLQDKLRSGKIEIWRSGLDKDVFEQIVVNAIAEIEDWRRKTESQNSVNPGILAGAIVASN
jgi:DNA-binding protein YbaB